MPIFVASSRSSAALRSAVSLISRRYVSSGDWTAAVFLPPGIYPYLFCADGVWYNDPRDDGRAPCEWGHSYSLKVVV